MRIAICATLTMIAFAACSRQESWKDRLPTVDCEPRTARAKAELGPIPKLAHFEHPTLAEQQEIVRRVAGLFALADQLEQRLAQARKQVDKLTPSLLARAFAGKLVPQNPADEPAEKLLERIQQAEK